MDTALCSKFNVTLHVPSYVFRNRGGETERERKTKKNHIKIINYKRHGYLLLAVNVSVCKCDSATETAVVRMMLIRLYKCHMQNDDAQTLNAELRNRRKSNEKKTIHGSTKKNDIAAKLQWAFFPPASSLRVFRKYMSFMDTHLFSFLGQFFVVVVVHFFSSSSVSFATNDSSFVAIILKCIIIFIA